MAFELFNPYDNPNNYVFDDAKIEVTGGESKLVAQVTPGTAYIYAKLDDNQGLVAIDSSGNNRHGAFQGGLDEGDWTTGKINSAVEGIGTTGGFINFDQYGNFIRTQAFSLECWFKYTSTATQSIISKQSNIGNFEGYAINLLAGKPRMVIRDDVGNRISIETAGTYNDGNWHHIVMSYDGSSVIGGVNFYVDNVLDEVIIVSETLTGSIGTTANLQISGRDGNNNTLDIGSVVDEVVIYDRELTAADVSFRWNGGAGTQILPGAATTYPIDNPTIRPRTTSIITELTNFESTIVASGSDTVKFILVFNGENTYWNGSTWTVSDGTYSQSNALAEIQANLSSLTLTGNVSYNYKALLHSEDGSTTPLLQDVTSTFNVSTTPADVERCTVWAENRDSENNPDTSPIKIRLFRDAVKYKDETVIRDDEIIVIPDNITGLWEINLVENENMEEGAYYIFEFNGEKYNKIVPNESRVNFWSLDDA